MSGRNGGATGRSARALLVLLAVGACLLLLAAWRTPVLGFFREPQRLRGLVERLGPAGPLAIVLLQAAQVLLAPIPGQAVSVVSGFLYGPWLGALYSMLGLLAGTVLALWLVRRWGRPLVERMVDPQTMARVDRLARSLGAPLLFLICVLPFLPDDMILLAAGLTSIPVPGIVLAAFLGRLPGVLIAAWLGRGASELSAPQWAAIIVGAGALAAVGYAVRGRVEPLVWSLLERIGRGRERG